MEPLNTGATRQINRLAEKALANDRFYRGVTMPRPHGRSLYRGKPEKGEVCGSLFVARPSRDNRHIIRTEVANGRVRALHATKGWRDMRAA